VRIDDLDLAFDEESERGRHRHRRRRSGRGGDSAGRGRGGRTAVALLMSLVVVAALAGAVWYGFDKLGDFFKAPDYNSGGTGEVTVQVLENQTAAQIGAELERLDVVKSQKAFVQAAKENPRSKEIQPGVYKLRKQMRASDALLLLLDRETSRQVLRFTIPEGKTVKEVLDIAAKATNIPLADFQAATKDPVAAGVPDWWFNRRDGKPAAKSIEGFLFPQTYEFNPVTEQYERVADMHEKRWYPTLTGLADGSVLAVSGLDGSGLVVDGSKNEVYDPKTKTWTLRKDLNHYFPTYPALFGLDRSRALAAECLSRAHQTLAAAKLTDGHLGAIADWVVARKK